MTTSMRRIQVRIGTPPVMLTQGTGKSVRVVVPRYSQPPSLPIQCSAA